MVGLNIDRCQETLEQSQDTLAWAVRAVTTPTKSHMMMVIQAPFKDSLPSNGMVFPSQLSSNYILSRWPTIRSPNHVVVSLSHTDAIETGPFFLFSFSILVRYVFYPRWKKSGQII